MIKQELLEILRCPVCKGELELEVRREEEGEIMEGILRCPKCSIDYTIEDGIPNLLPPEMR